MDQLAELTEEARKLALDRFRVIQPHLEQNQSLQSVADAAGIEPCNAGLLNIGCSVNAKRIAFGF